MATGWIVPPISKLPFLNIMTDVLLIQVPVTETQTDNIQPSNHDYHYHHHHHHHHHHHVTLTFRKYKDGKFGLCCYVSSEPAERKHMSVSHQTHLHQHFHKTAVITDVPILSLFDCNVVTNPECDPRARGCGEHLVHRK